MALEYDMMTNVVVVVSFAAALSAVFLYALSRPSPLRVHRSRSRRSCSRGTQHHVMTSFPWKDLRHYSPTHVLLQVDYSSPIGYYSPFVPSVLPLYSSSRSDPYGPYSVQLYCPPPPPEAARNMITLSSVFPMKKMYYTSFVIPPYSDPYGSTAIQLYSPYNPKPLQRGSDMPEAICLGENQCEAASFGIQLTHSALPCASYGPSLLYTIFSPMLGLLITALLLGITLGASAMFCALRRQGGHTRESDNHESQENVSDLSSIEHLSSHEHYNMERYDSDYQLLPSRKNNHLERNEDSDRIQEINESRYERLAESKQNKKSSTRNGDDQVRAKHSKVYEEPSPMLPNDNLNKANRKMRTEILPFASTLLSTKHDTICSLEVIDELADNIQEDIIFEILHDMVPPACHSYGGGYIWKCKESPEICRLKSSLSRKERKILESNICPDCGSQFVKDMRSL